MTDNEKEHLIECIPSGRENAASAAEIGKAAGMDRRSVSKRLFRMMCDGEWIAVAFTENGSPLYYLPDSREGLKNAVTALREREMKLRRELKPVKALRKNWNTPLKTGEGGRKNEMHDSDG